MEIDSCRSGSTLPLWNQAPAESVNIRRQISTKNWEFHKKLVVYNLGFKKARHTCQSARKCIYQFWIILLTAFVRRRSGCSHSHSKFDHRLLIDRPELQDLLLQHPWCICQWTQFENPRRKKTRMWVLNKGKTAYVTGAAKVAWRQCGKKNARKIGAPGFPVPGRWGRSEWLFLLTFFFLFNTILSSSEHGASLVESLSSPRYWDRQ